MGSVARKWLGKGAGVANSNLSAERQLASSWATSQGLARLPAALAKELEKGMPGKVKATDGLLKVLMSPDPKTSAIPILSTWSPPGLGQPWSVHLGDREHFTYKVASPPCRRCAKNLC